MPPRLQLTVARSSASRTASFGTTDADASGMFEPVVDMHRSAAGAVEHNDTCRVSKSRTQA
jgi:hypothetical protein